MTGEIHFHGMTGCELRSDAEQAPPGRIHIGKQATYFTCTVLPVFAAS